ncbi:MAG TPA: two-component regulator propeller domain-containing protein [Candidatus Eisenbacteria bacterium]|nr:two-component regulator propeller domain-containing protein [Candidatus Eisenbacteria bacterium]
MRQSLARSARNALVLLGLTALAPAAARAGAWQAFSNANNLVSVAALDPYVWMPDSSHGVNRYDPATGAFTYYFHDPGALASNSVTVVSRDADSTIWFGTQDQGASLLAKDGSWRQVGLFQGLLGLRITALEPYQTGMWVGTDQGLAFFVGDKLQAIWPDGVSPSPFLSPVIRDITTSSNRTWVATANGVYTTTSGVAWDSLSAGLTSRDVVSIAFDGTTLWAVAANKSIWSGGETGTWTQVAGPPAVGITARAGQVYLAATGSVCRWNALAQGFNDLGGPAAASLDVSGDGTLWAGNGQGLFRWDGASWTQYRAPGPVQSWIYGLVTQGNTVYATCRDQNGVLGGVSRYDPARGWRHFLDGPDTDTSLVTHDFIIMAGVDHLGRKWFADWTSSIAILDDSGPVPQFTHLFRDTSQFATAWAFFDDPRGYYWLGLDTGCRGCGPQYDPQGLVRLDSQLNPVNFLPANAQMSGNQVRAIGQAPDGNLWVTYADVGVDIFNDRNLQTRVAHLGVSQGLHSNNTWGLAFSGNTAWVLTDGGLSKFAVNAGGAPSYQSTILTPAMSSLGALHPLVVDGEGGAWVASKLGLYHVKPDGTTEIFNEDNSPLLNNDVHSLALDASGGLWMGSIGGLNRLDLAGLSAGVASATLALAPNPLRISGGATTFSLATAEGVAYGRSPLEIRDARGRLVADLRTDSRGNTTWNGTDLNGRRCPAGVYFVRVVSYGYGGAPEPLAQARLVLLP